jgi:glycogen debranching enzyme
MLAGAYYERTGNLEIIDQLWPNLVAALEWMDTHGDIDGDGFIEYARHGDSGLIQQGWKDSSDSIFHADGELADGPIALCEVQAYAYAAWIAAAQLASLKGDSREREWRGRAERLRTRFDEAFWCRGLDTYALALDKHKQPCQVRTSNPGHCLFAGIVPSGKAELVSRSLWPHDNAVIAQGMARYGYTASARRILNAMFDLSDAVDLHRLPELICGFDRRGDEHPTLYPVACAPQAWAAGAAYLLVAACLGLRIDAPSRRLTFARGHMPRDVEWITLSNLTIADARLDLRLERHEHDVGVTVLRREGDVEVLAVK